MNFDNIIYKENNEFLSISQELLDHQDDGSSDSDLYYWTKSRYYQFTKQFTTAQTYINLLSKDSPIIYFTLLSYEAFLLGNKKHALQLLNNIPELKKPCVKFDIFIASLLLLYSDYNSLIELINNKHLCLQYWNIEPLDFTTKFSHDILRKAAGLEAFSNKSNSFLIDNRIIASSFIKSAELVSFGNYDFSNDLKEILSHSNL